MSVKFSSSRSRLGRRYLLAQFAALPLLACGPPVTSDPADRAPGWQLEDVQPASDRFEEEYGPEGFAGTTLLVALLSGENDQARAVAAALEALYEECVDEGLAVSFCIVNKAGDEGASALTEVVGFPVFQDRADVDAWGRHRGRAFDVFVYDAGGATLEATNLATETSGTLSDAAHARLKNALSAD
jgi:hypothetical protein